MPQFPKRSHCGPSWREFLSPIYGSWQRGWMLRTSKTNDTFSSIFIQGSKLNLRSNHTNLMKGIGHKFWRKESKKTKCLQCLFYSHSIISCHRKDDLIKGLQYASSSKEEKEKIKGEGKKQWLILEEGTMHWYTFLHGTILYAVHGPETNIQWKQRRGCH